MSFSTQLAALVEQIDRGEDVEQAREKATQILKQIAPADLVRIEDELVQNGLSLDKVRHLCCSHMRASAGERDGFRARLPEGHVVATMMDEHSHILERLERLEQVVEAVPGDAPDPQTLEEIHGIATFLVGTEPHHQREEKILFPLLMDRGMTGPPTVMTAEHVELRMLKHEVQDGARALLDGQTRSWSEVRDPALSLVQMLREHIFKEDHILYPMAVQVIQDPEVWVEARRRCDEVGYCCHHPAG